MVAGPALASGDMTGAIRAPVRAARYALPNLVGRILPGESAAEAAAACEVLDKRGFKTTAGFFGANDTDADAVVAANLALGAALAHKGCDTLIAVKAPALNFDMTPLRALARIGIPLIFDALTEPHAERTLTLARDLGAGVALPARWRRSQEDARVFRVRPGRIRAVKGEWPDPAGDMPDVEAAYLDLIASLAGRKAPVGVATHDPVLARKALGILLDAGTPCELEQLRGLPRRRTTAVARDLGVPVRLYYPFGPGWWPYAIDKALARPHLPLWALRDALGL